jgi:hypothetical protein
MARKLPGAFKSLAESRVWTRWRPVTKDGKVTKPPCDARGRPKGAETDPATLSEIGDAWPDIGVILGPATGLIGIDIDHCGENGKCASWLSPLLSRAKAAGAFVEISVSRTGIHIIGRSASFPKGHSFAHPFDPAFPQAKIECFSEKRYFTLANNLIFDPPELGCIDDVFRAALAMERKAPKKADELLKRSSDDTSKDFFAAMQILRRAGWTPDEAAAYALRWPEGAAAQYIREDKVLEQARVCHEKGRASDFGDAPGGAPGGADADEVEIPGYHWSPNCVTDDEGKIIFNNGVRAVHAYQGGMASFDIKVYDHKEKCENTLHLDWLETSGFVREYTGRALCQASNAALKRYLEVAFVHLQGLGRVTRVHDRFGWTKDDAFVLGEYVYAEGRVEPAKLTIDTEARGQLLAPVGTLEKWRETAARLCHPGLEPFLAALLASAGAPLISRVWGKEGGFVLSYFGHVSGSGKSTALSAAASVWGEAGCIALGSSATDHHRFYTLAVLRHLPVTWDEAKSTPESQGKNQSTQTPLVSILQAFTDGTERGRLGTKGKPVAAQSGWSTALFMAGNKSKIGVLVGTEEGAAQAQRIIEFNCQKKITSGMLGWAPFTKEDFEANGGHIGRAIARYLSIKANRDAAVARLKEVYAGYISATGADKRFQMRALSVIRVMGEIMDAEGWLPIDADRLESVLMEALRASEVNAAELAKAEEALEPAALLESYIQSAVQRDSVFQPGNGKVSLRRNNQLVGFLDRVKQIAVFDHHDFDHYLRSRGSNVRETREALEASNRIVKSKQRRNLGQADGLAVPAFADVAVLVPVGGVDIEDDKVIPFRRDL